MHEYSNSAYNPININPNTVRIYRGNLRNNGRGSAAVSNLHLSLLI